MELEKFFKEQSLWTNKLLVDYIVVEDFTISNTYSLNCDNASTGHFTLSLSLLYGSCYYLNEDEYFEFDNFPISTMAEAVHMPFEAMEYNTSLILDLEEKKLKKVRPEEYHMAQYEFREMLKKVSCDTIKQLKSRGKERSRG